MALKEVLASFGIEVDKGNNLGKADKRVDAFTDKLAGLGKLIVGAFAAKAIVSFGGDLLKQADALAKQSKALGVSAAALQGWQHAAQLSGSSAEEFNGALTKFSRNVAEAGDNAKGPAADALKALGLSAKDAAGNLQAPIDLLDGVVAGLEGVQDPAKRTQIAMDLFGKSGARLLPLLSEGEEGLKKLRAEVGELGAGFDEAFLQQAQEVNDNLDRLKLGLRGIATQVLSAILPTITAFTKRAVAVTKSIIGWVKGTKLIQAGLVALTAKGVFALVKAVPLLVARLGGLRVILATLGKFILRTLAPFLILEDIIVFLTGGKSAIGKGLDAAFGEGTAKSIQDLVKEMVKFFGLFKSEPDEVRRAFSKLPDDLEKDLGGFGKFLGEWGQEIVNVGLFAVNALTGGWANFATKAKAAGQGVLLALKIVWTEIKFGFLAAAAAISDAFDAAWAKVLAGANSALNALADVLAALPGSTGAADSLRKTGSDLLEGAPKGGAGEFISKERERERFRLADEFDRIGAVATAPAGAPRAGDTNITQTAAPVTNINVTVPPGTDAAGVAKATGKAAGDANLRAVKAALVPTPG